MIPRRARFSPALVLAASLVAAAVLGGAGCGGAAEPVPPGMPAMPATPANTGVVPVASGASGAPVASGVSAKPSATPAASGSPHADVMGNNTPIRPTALLADVQKLGIDTTKPFSAMSKQQVKQVMKLFKQALGYETCEGCHVANDYQKPTRNREISRQMWDHFLAQLRDDKGGALFCDSCHAGKAKPLDRSAMDGLERIMETDYQGKLTRADKQPHDCSTCHGKGKEPEPKIIEKLWGIAAK